MLDRLVIAKLSELHAAKVLADAQQRAGRAVTVYGRIRTEL